jgi:hypothetical protein
VVWCGVVWCGVVWCGVVWCGVVWCGVVWCGVVVRWRCLCGVGCGGLCGGCAVVVVARQLDVLDGLDYVKIGVAYKVDGRVLAPGQMPSTLDGLKAVEVVYESTCRPPLMLRCAPRSPCPRWPDVALRVP